jgi:hypothetical protein
VRRNGVLLYSVLVQCMLVHCPSSLDSTSSVFAIELNGGNGVFAHSAFELGKAIHFCDSVISHVLIVGAHPRHDSELKLPWRENGKAAMFWITWPNVSSSAGVVQCRCLPSSARACSGVKIVAFGAP